jgi:hypothetical protein
MFLGLARFVSKGPFQAALTAATLLMLGLLVPPLIWLSAAVPALVFLRVGQLAGLRVVGIAVSAACGFGLLALGQVLQPLMMAAMFWVPACSLAILLRRTVRLDWCLISGAGMGALLVLALFATLGDPSEFWREAMRATFPVEQFASEAQIDVADLQASMDGMARLMTGGLAATLVISAYFALLLARSWQAALYNPGGFRSEFHELRLGQIAAAVATVICALAIVTGNLLLVSVAMVCLALYLFQGLAVVHGAVGRRGMNRGWLFGLYALLVFLMPHMMLLLGALGMADAWIDLRARLGGKAS